METPFFGKICYLDLGGYQIFFNPEATECYSSNVYASYVACLDFKQLYLLRFVAIINFWVPSREFVVLSFIIAFGICYIGRIA